MAQWTVKIRPRKHVEVEPIATDIQLALSDVKGEWLTEMKDDDLILSCNHSITQQFCVADAAPHRSERRRPTRRLYNESPRCVKKEGVCGMDAATLRPHIVRRPEFLRFRPVFPNIRVSKATGFADVIRGMAQEQAKTSLNLILGESFGTKMQRDNERGIPVPVGHVQGNIVRAFDTMFVHQCCGDGVHRRCRHYGTVEAVGEITETFAEDGQDFRANGIVNVGHG